jgi:hypothetical protein
MYGESRQTSGSFYTPRDVVRKLVDEAIGGYLEDATWLEEARVARVLEGVPVELDDADLELIDEDTDAELVEVANDHGDLDGDGLGFDESDFDNADDIVDIAIVASCLVKKE